MNEIQWEAEPDLDGLRQAYGLMRTDPSAAITRLEALAARGSVASMLYLAGGYRNGEQLNRDIEKAKYWYQQADQRGFGPAAYMLGVLHLELGEYAAALASLVRGTEEQYPPAMYRLATMYRDGVGVKKDLGRYREYLELAVLKGHIFAKRDLGALLTRGAFGIRASLRGLMILLSLPRDM